MQTCSALLFEHTIRNLAQVCWTLTPRVGQSAANSATPLWLKGKIKSWAFLFLASYQHYICTLSRLNACLCGRRPTSIMCTVHILIRPDGGVSLKPNVEWINGVDHHVRRLSIVVMPTIGESLPQFRVSLPIAVLPAISVEVQYEW